jgi:3-oxoacyl-[acyl-carrier protein] reductase
VTARAVLVTGGARGIGRAISLAFAALGDRVAVHYGSSADAAEDLVATLPGSGHASVQADMRSADEVRRAVDDAASRLGRLDVLVNNAGIFVPHPPTSTSYDDWQPCGPTPWAPTSSEPPMRPSARSLIWSPPVAAPS